MMDPIEIAYVVTCGLLIIIGVFAGVAPFWKWELLRDPTPGTCAWSLTWSKPGSQVSNIYGLCLEIEVALRLGLLFQVTPASDAPRVVAVDTYLGPLTLGFAKTVLD